VEFRSAIDGDVSNSLVERYRELSSRHLAVTDSRELSGDSVLLTARTVESQVCVALAARTTLWRGDTPVPADYRLAQYTSHIGHHITVSLGTGESVTVEKVATIFHRA
jgi:alpha,alpha-trehalase